MQHNEIPDHGMLRDFILLLTEFSVAVAGMLSAFSKTAFLMHPTTLPRRNFQLPLFGALRRQSLGLFCKILKARLM